MKCVLIDDLSGPLTITSIYIPPKHAIKNEPFQQFLETLGNRFIAGGDFNYKL